MGIRAPVLLALLVPLTGMAAQAPGTTPARRGGPPDSAASLRAAPAAQLGHTPAPDLARFIRDTSLGNGLAVIVIENHTVPLATVEIAVRTGAFTQDSGTEGVPHLFEHMLFKSYVGYLGAGERTFGQEASELDAIHNGTTAEEEVTYFLTLPSVFVDRGMALLAHLLEDPVFTQDNLDEERRVVLDEFNRDQSDPEYRLRQAVEQRLWTTAWGRKNPLGDRAAIAQATPKRLRDIFRRYYVPNNAALIVSGDVRPAVVFAMARHAFGDWHRGEDPFATHPVPPIPPLTHSSVVVVPDDVKNVVVRLEWQGPSASHDRADTYAADVLASIVDDPGSRFQRHLVDSGLFTAVNLAYLTLDHRGPVTLLATTTTDSLPRALDALRQELTALGAPDAFTAAELANSKQARAVDAALELDHPTGVAHTVGFWWSVAGLDYYMDYTSRMAAVTRADLQRYVDRYLLEAPAALGFLVPKASAADLRAPIDAFANTLPLPVSAAAGGP